MITLGEIMKRPTEYIFLSDYKPRSIGEWVSMRIFGREPRLLEDHERIIDKPTPTDLCLLSNSEKKKIWKSLSVVEKTILILLKQFTNDDLLTLDELTWWTWQEEKARESAYSYEGLIDMMAFSLSHLNAQQLIFNDYKNGKKAYYISDRGAAVISEKDKVFKSILKNPIQSPSYDRYLPSPIPHFLFEVHKLSTGIEKPEFCFEYYIEDYSFEEMQDQTKRMFGTGLYELRIFSSDGILSRRQSFDI